MQVVELLIAAAVAAIVLSMLYSVLGRRVGRQPEEVRDGERPSIRPNRATPRLEEAKSREPVSGLASLRTKEPGFDTDRFLEGARHAYQTIVKGYSTGDADALRKLTTSNVLRAFEQGIAQREAQGRTDQVEFLSAPRADIDTISVTGDLARIKVRFLAELRTRSKDDRGEAVDDHRTAEFWTFERTVPSRDPNWTLARVESAEA